MLQIPEPVSGGGVGIAVANCTSSAATSRKVPSPENGLSNLLREFLGWQSSGGIDLDHATFKAAGVISEAGSGFPASGATFRKIGAPHDGFGSH
jgi:hypothetical protein